MAKKKKPIDDEPKKKPKKPTRVRDDDADDAVERPARAKSGNDAYTGLAAIATVAFLAAAVLFYLDYAQATSQQLTPPTVKVPAMGALPAAG